MSAAFVEQVNQLSRFAVFLYISRSIHAKSIRDYLNGVRQVHLRQFRFDSLGHHFDSSGSFVKLVTDGIRLQERAKGYVVVRKHPFTWQMLCSSAPFLRVNFGLETLAAVGIMFLFMLRASEAVVCPRSSHHLLVKDCTFFHNGVGTSPTGVRLYIKSSKSSAVPVFRSVLGGCMFVSCEVAMGLHVLVRCTDVPHFTSVPNPLSTSGFGVC